MKKLTFRLFSLHPLILSIIACAFLVLGTTVAIACQSCDPPETSVATVDNDMRTGPGPDVSAVTPDGLTSKGTEIYLLIYAGVDQGKIPIFGPESQLIADAKKADGIVASYYMVIIAESAKDPTGGHPITDLATRSGNPLTDAENLGHSLPGIAVGSSDDVIFHVYTSYMVLVPIGAGQPNIFQKNNSVYTIVQITDYWDIGGQATITSSITA